MKKKKTHEDFEKEYYTKFPDSSVVFKSNYTGANEKIKCYCKIHDYTWETSPSTLLRGSGKCPKCSNCAQKTHEEFVEQYFKKFPNSQIEFLSEYTTKRDKIICKCKIDDNIWETTPFQLMHGAKCCICHKNSHPLLKDEKEYAEEFYQKYGKEYSLLSNYAGAFEKVHIIHNDCGKDFWIEACRIFDNNRKILCPSCSIKHGALLKTGANSINWKGGQTELKAYGRSVIKEWNKISLQEYNYTCIISGNTNNFLIHHVNRNFSEMFHETIHELSFEKYQTVGELTDEQIANFSKVLLEKHFNSGWGVPITWELHEEFHSKYGKTNNTVDQLIEFATTKGVTLIKILDEQNRIKLERVEKDNTQDGK